MKYRKEMQKLIAHTIKKRESQDDLIAEYFELKKRYGAVISVRFFCEAKGNLSPSSFGRKIKEYKGDCTEE
ncbi:hypothetical protein [Enterococcus sp. AZ072]|uniref:hypothetical protein n=1 Tax=unclassified Enterococcus TaxID=2608891 RepID=UPI003D2931A3